MSNIQKALTIVLLAAAAATGVTTASGQAAAAAEWQLIDDWYGFGSGDKCAAARDRERAAGGWADVKCVKSGHGGLGVDLMGLPY